METYGINILFAKDTQCTIGIHKVGATAQASLSSIVTSIPYPQQS